MKKVILICLIFINLNLLFTIENIYPLDSDYTKWEEILPKIKSLGKKYPHLVQWKILGKTATNKFPIYAINISNFSASQDKPEILVIGQHHSEEPLGVEIAFDLAKSLTKSKNTGNLVDSFSWWIVPTINPEGMYYFQKGFYDHKRKNNSDTNNNGKFDIYTDGVDLNKNYNFNWTNNFPRESRYFAGDQPESEKEIQIISKFMREHIFQLAYFLHSSYSGNFSEMIFFPWKRDNQKSYNFENMLELAKVLQKNLRKDYKNSNYKIYSNDLGKQGFARDYIYANYGTFAFTIETCGIKNGIPVVFPKNKIMRQIVKKNSKAILTCSKYFYDNLRKVKVVDLSGKPISYKRYFLKNQKEKFPIHRTNKFGSFYIYKDKIKSVVIDKMSYSISDTIHTFISSDRE